MSNTPSIRLDALAISAIYPGLAIGQKKKTAKLNYDDDQKKEIVRYAGNNSINSAAERFNVSTMSIYNWKKEFPEAYNKNKK